MDEPLSTKDAELRSILTEVSMGRLTVDEAYNRIDELQTPASTARGATQIKKASIGAGVLIMLFGGVFAAVGGFMGSKSLNLMHDSAQVEGSVVRHVRSGDKGNRAPVVKYVVLGKDYELGDTIGSNHPPAIGSKVDVVYKVDEPEVAQINSFVQRWLFPTVFGGIGSVIVLIGFAVIVAGIRAKFRAATTPVERFTV